MKVCKQKALEFLESGIANLKQKISCDKYTDLDKFRADLDSLRSHFLETGPRFNGRFELILEVQMSLLTRAAEFLAISSRKE